jgi:large subunit ribosomal protein L21
MNKFAVVKYRNEQYLVEEGKTYEMNRIEAQEGDKITFDEILLKVEGDKVEIGQPTIKDAKVEGEVAEHTRGEKVIKMTYKAKTRERKKVGHRQDLTVIKINKIS